MVKVWRRSTVGPDWTDIRTFMREMERLHRCRCYLEMYPDFIAHGPALRLVLTCCSNEPGSDLHSCEESTAGMWPNVNNQSVEGLAYALLVKLDHVLLDKWWRQEVFTLP